MEAIVILVVVLIFEQASCQQQVSEVDNSESDWLDGDAVKCLEQFRKSDMKVKRFEVLPGIGWDNLRNVEQGMAVDYTFKSCKVTEDGHFLIPDNIFTVPIKSSSVERLAEVIEHWHDASSTTSNSVNVEAGLNLWRFSISGKFSYEHTDLKSKQAKDKAVTVRVQLRYMRYEARLQPDPKLSATFRNRLLYMANLIQWNQTEAANYEGQLLVRDFGTHVLTGVTAGAGLMKDDYLKSEFVKENSEKKTDILASATASFLNIFKLSASYGHKTDNQVDEGYSNSLTHSFVQTLGGPMFKADNMTINSWTSGVDSNLVAMDRTADPLNFLITRNSLPELPINVVYELEKIVRNSIEEYYEKNTIYGCTDISYPNFIFSANVDDGSCYAKQFTFYFGGGYQQCERKDDIGCEKYNRVNPMTNDYTCPEKHRAVQVMSTKKLTEKNQSVLVQTFWCYSNEYTGLSSYEFGGVFNEQEVNIFTNTKGCPAGYYAIDMFYDFSICVSIKPDNTNVPLGGSIGFGGFFSTTFGNPLSFSDNVLPKSIFSDPKSCPAGYSVVVSTFNAHKLFYCVITSKHPSTAKYAIKRPPFKPKPEIQEELISFRSYVKSQYPDKTEKSAKQDDPMPPVKASLPSRDKEEKEIDDITSGNFTGVSLTTALASILIAVVGFVLKRVFHLPHRAAEVVPADPPATR